VPSMGNYSSEIMDDLALITGATVIRESKKFNL